MCKRTSNTIEISHETTSQLHRDLFETITHKNYTRVIDLTGMEWAESVNDFEIDLSANKIF